MTRDLLNKPNHGYIFKRFRDLVIGFMYKTDPSNIKWGNRKKKRVIK